MHAQRRMYLASTASTAYGHLACAATATAAMHHTPQQPSSPPTPAVVRANHCAVQEVAKALLPYYVAERGERPQIPRGMPAGFATLMQRCWAGDPSAR